MANRHKQAVNAALDQGEKLKRMFEQMGDAAHPRGRILAAYRVARRALQGNLASPVAVQETLAELQRSVRDALNDMLGVAVAGGAAQAEANLLAYGQAPAPSATDVSLAISTILEPLDTQIAQVRLLAMSGDNESLVLGDDERAGILAPGAVTREAARWLAWALEVGFWELIDNTIGRSRERWVKQAVAAIDERTTDCCLRVNGQTQPLGKPFQLTGTPRFADRVDQPPFHYYCRTAMALVQAADADDPLTREMQAAANAELRARRDKSRVEIVPADARSRR